MRKYIWIIFLISFVSGIANPAVGAFQQPNMADYTAFPVFLTQYVQPNIMILLDNSKSMDVLAYSRSGAYTGSPYNLNSGTFSNRVEAGFNDMEEGSNGIMINNKDLDLASFNPAGGDSIVGIRFQDLDIPQGATILSASIDFVASDSETTTTNLDITGDASDDASVFERTVSNLSNRTETTASVSWNNMPSWTVNRTYTTPDLTSILQEIVNRSGWTPGNSMAFLFNGSGLREAHSFNGDSQKAPRLNISYDIQINPLPVSYYGYFNSDYFYTYGSNKFNLAYEKISYDAASGNWKAQDLNGASTTLDNSKIAREGLWDGNWLNWLCMRRIDVMRKVIMGGSATAPAGTGDQINYGSVPWHRSFSRSYTITFDSSNGPAVSPFHGSHDYEITDAAQIQVNNTNYSIRIQKDIDYEPEDFLNGNLAGVLQRVGDDARWGNTWFNNGRTASGGTVANTIGTDITTIADDLQNTICDTWTPLAESFYTVVQYFKQEKPPSSLGYPAGAVPISTNADPYYNGAELVSCAKSFVILLTDGASFADSNIPNSLKDYDKDGDSVLCDKMAQTNCDYNGGGTDFLDDVALYARINDLRGDLADDQNIILYTIYAFGNHDHARSLLQDAARNGGFEDQNGNNLPDLTEEYDADGDGAPDTYFEASDGYDLKAKIYAAVTDILSRNASGTAASVLSTNSEGEGNTMRAWFRPSVISNLEKAKWLGYIDSLWVDTDGNLREDTNQNAQLDASDLEITFGSSQNGDTIIIREGKKLPIEDLNPIFEVGERLAERVPNSRKIFTCIDKNTDGQIIDTSSDPYDASGEILAFSTANASQLQPYLGVADDKFWGDSSAGLGATIGDRATNIISWVRGADIAGLRNRTLNNVTWPLGDIVNSSPVIVSKPPEKFHIWYSDQSYKTYYDAVKDRETVIYVGANDGMLHAFTSWDYDSDNTAYVKPSGASANERIGDELWAFVPQAVLPHLKWISHEDYTHTFLVDGKPRIFDAKILNDDTHYTDGDSDPNWGTILVMGMNMGAKQISVFEDFGSGSDVERTFYPSYICMDITDPRNPVLLWEKAYPDAAMTRAVPAPVKVDDQWYLVFGSGPTDYDGTSAQSSYLYVADMKTGDLLKKFGPYESNAFFSTAAAFDKNLNYNVDGIYIGNSNWTQPSNTSSQDVAQDDGWQGSVYKIAVPCTNCQWQADYKSSQDYGYDIDPANWYAHKLFSSNRPITAPPTVSVEAYPDFDVDNVWIYFGTGRHLAGTDKSTSDEQYIYGIKDPYFNKQLYENNGMHDYSQAQLITIDHQGSPLFESDLITVTTGGHVLQSGSLYGSSGSFDELVDDIRNNYDGWLRPLETNATSPSERMISKPSVFAGLTFFPVFTPEEDICGLGGSSNLYGLYYLTGTGYTKQIFQVQTPIIDSTTGEKVVEVKMPDSMVGSPPPSLGIHTGSESGGKVYMQQSTGEIVEIDIGAALYFKSTITDWWDRVEK